MAKFNIKDGRRTIASCSTPVDAALVRRELERRLSLVEEAPR